MSSARSDILTGPIGPTLVRLATPMLIGIASIILFNVVDTFWVGQLGATELAAMSFTFPVVFVVMNLGMGMGIGATAVISRAVGEGDRHDVKLLTTSALILALLLVTTVALIGLFTIEPLFEVLGATPELVALIGEYMEVWYLGVGFVVIPMVGNSAIRATGDTKTPSYVMLVAGFVNLILDPFLIFGWGPFPRLELQGAALATVISYVLSFAAALYVLIRRERMLLLRLPRYRQTIDAWKRIMHVGVPSAATNMLAPMSAGVLTRMVAEHGPASVAAFGVGTRVESLSLVGIFALTTAVAPFIGQNFGAKNCERIRGAIRFSLAASMVWGLSAALILGLLAGPISRIFNDEAVVLAGTTSYLRLVPISYGFLGIAQLVSASFNAMDKPLRGAILLGTRLLVLAIPFAYVGSRLYGVDGIFIGVSAANFAVGFGGIAMVFRHVGHVERRFTREAAASVA